jgi:hypothetical protein
MGIVAARLGIEMNRRKLQLDPSGPLNDAAARAEMF